VPAVSPFREAGRLHGWEDKIWSRRYQAIVVSPEEAAQIERLGYVLSNGCKEGPVARPQDWPGVHSARALVQGAALTGTWFDRTQEYAARRRGRGARPSPVRDDRDAAPFSPSLLEAPPRRGLAGARPPPDP
jgi:hypothetical protein